MTTKAMGSLTLEENGAILVPDDEGGIHIVHGGEINPATVAEVQDSQKCTIVDWDPETDEWVSWLRNGVELVRGKDRKEVVRLEHEILAGMIARGEHVPDDNLRSAVAWHCRRWVAKLKSYTHV
jgi:hypothetical protein